MTRPPKYIIGHDIGHGDDFAVICVMKIHNGTTEIVHEEKVNPGDRSKEDRDAFRYKVAALAEKYNGIVI